MLTIEQAIDPICMTADCDVIYLTVKFRELPEPIGFIAMPTDPEAHGRFLYAEAKSGAFGPVTAFVPHPEGVSDGSQPKPA